MFRKTALLLLLTACAGLALAQESSVYGKIEPREIRIGEQSVLHYELVQPAQSKFSIPDFSDSVCVGVELVRQPVLDTVRLEDQRIQVNIDYIVTSFDSGFFFIPSQLFVDERGRELESKPMSLSVTTVEVDPQNDPLRPEKDVMDMQADGL